MNIHAVIIFCNVGCQQLLFHFVLRLGPFDFADLDICLRLVDRTEGGANQVPLPLSFYDDMIHAEDWGWFDCFRIVLVNPIDSSMT